MKVGGYCIYTLSESVPCKNVPLTLVDEEAIDESN